MNLFDLLLNDKSELITQRDLILNAFINKNLYGLKVEYMNSMVKSNVFDRAEAYNDDFILLPCFCIAKEEIGDIPDIVWVQKKAIGNGFNEMMLEQLKGIVATKKPDSQLYVDFQSDKSKSILKKIDTVKEFWYLWDLLVDDKSSFIDNLSEMLCQFKKGTLYGLKKQEDTFTNNSEPSSYLLPCFCSVFSASKDGTDNRAMLMWVHSKSRRNGFGRKLVELLEIKKAYDILDESELFWEKCKVIPCNLILELLCNSSFKKTNQIESD